MKQSIGGIITECFFAADELSFHKSTQTYVVQTFTHFLTHMWRNRFTMDKIFVHCFSSLLLILRPRCFSYRRSGQLCPWVYDALINALLKPPITRQNHRLLSGLKPQSFSALVSAMNRLRLPLSAAHTQLYYHIYNFTSTHVNKIKVPVLRKCGLGILNPLSLVMLAGI